jgi:N-formylglutamate amidohydrolase
MFAAYEPCMPGIEMKFGCEDESPPSPISVQTAGASRISASSANSGEAPAADEIQDRLQRYWRPYHERLASELQALRARHGIALLFEAHTIRSRVPRLFDGRLPDINLGTADGKSCASDLAALLIETAGEAEAYSRVLNGRFKGGYITRRYGRPADGVHAVQLELVQLTYMDEDPPYGFREDLAVAIRPVLNAIVQAMIGWGARR